jgi:hypothetical protein
MRVPYDVVTAVSVPDKYSPLAPTTRCALASAQLNEAGLHSAHRVSGAGVNSSHFSWLIRATCDKHFDSERNTIFPLEQARAHQKHAQNSADQTYAA